MKSVASRSAWACWLAGNGAHKDRRRKAGFLTHYEWAGLFQFTFIIIDWEKVFHVENTYELTMSLW